MPLRGKEMISRVVMKMLKCPCKKCRPGCAYLVEKNEDCPLCAKGNHEKAPRVARK